jgi:hypothetical protein
MLDAPQGFEAEGLGQIAQAKFVAIDIPIGTSFACSLKNDSHADVHIFLLF